MYQRQNHSVYGALMPIVHGQRLQAALVLPAPHPQTILPRILTLSITLYGYIYVAGDSVIQLRSCYATKCPPTPKGSRWRTELLQIHSREQNVVWQTKLPNDRRAMQADDRHEQTTTSSGRMHLYHSRSVAMYMANRPAQVIAQRSAAFIVTSVHRGGLASPADCADRTSRGDGFGAAKVRKRRERQSCEAWNLLRTQWTLSIIRLGVAYVNLPRGAVVGCDRLRARSFWCEERVSRNWGWYIFISSRFRFAVFRQQSRLADVDRRWFFMPPFVSRNTADTLDLVDASNAQIIHWRNSTHSRW